MGVEDWPGYKYLERCLVTEVQERGGQQKQQELAHVMSIIGSPKRGVELGVHDGGTLWAWAHICDKICGVDIDPMLCRRENLELFDRIPLYGGSCRDPEVVEKVLGHLGGNPDFIFIDANHHDEEVVANFELWWPLLEDHGWMGFHDVRMAARGGWETVCDWRL